jgi:DNA-directed RNA polymerase specialized sigma24 family protein
MTAYPHIIARRRGRTGREFPDLSNRRQLPPPAIKVKNEITREKFTGFLEWLSPGGEGAGEAYERLRDRLCIFFSQRGRPFPDELADETINRVMLKAGEEEIENKLAYCYGVARNVLRESWRRDRRHADVEEVAAVAAPPAAQSFSNDCLEKCLGELPPESRVLILDYFSEDKTQKIELRQRISERLETTQTALRMRVARVKQRLKLCIQECMC